MQASFKAELFVSLPFLDFETGFYSVVQDDSKQFSCLNPPLHTYKLVN